MQGNSLVSVCRVREVACGNFLIGEYCLSDVAAHSVVVCVGEWSGGRFFVGDGVGMCIVFFQGLFFVRLSLRRNARRVSRIIPVARLM